MVFVPRFLVALWWPCGVFRWFPALIGVAKLNLWKVGVISSSLCFQTGVCERHEIDPFDHIACVSFEQVQQGCLLEWCMTCQFFIENVFWRLTWYKISYRVTSGLSTLAWYSFIVQVQWGRFAIRLPTWYCLACHFYIVHMTWPMPKSCISHCIPQAFQTSHIRGQAEHSVPLSSQRSIHKEKKDHLVWNLIFPFIRWSYMGVSENSVHLNFRWLAPSVRQHRLFFQMSQRLVLL